MRVHFSSLTSECDSRESRSLHPASSTQTERFTLAVDERGKNIQEKRRRERERVWIKASLWNSHSFSLWSETERWRDGGRVSFLSLHLTLERLSLSICPSTSFYHSSLSLSVTSLFLHLFSFSPFISLFCLLSTPSFVHLFLSTSPFSFSV